MVSFSILRDKRIQKFWFPSQDVPWHRLVGRVGPDFAKAQSRPKISRGRAIAQVTAARAERPKSDYLTIDIRASSCSKMVRRSSPFCGVEVGPISSKGILSPKEHRRRPAWECVGFGSGPPGVIRHERWPKCNIVRDKAVPELSRGACRILRPSCGFAYFDRKTAQKHRRVRTNQA